MNRPTLSALRVELKSKTVDPRDGDAVRLRRMLRQYREIIELSEGVQSSFVSLKSNCSLRRWLGDEETTSSFWFQNVQRASGRLI